ncbi:MAG: DUF2141 domain-containing protein [Bacteroidota bacterium]
MKRTSGILLLLFLSTCLPAKGQKCVLEVLLHNIRNTDGTVSVAVYRTTEEWPYEPSFSFKLNKNIMSGQAMRFLTDTLLPGRYALSVLDDENDNGEMDYFCGIPREGWGFCNNPAVIRLRAPGFDLCSFEIRGDTTTLEVKINYIGSGAKER